MVQRGRDPLTGADRDHVFVAPPTRRARDRRRRPDRRANEHGEMRGRASRRRRPGTLQAHWPETNV
jgi:hypothetical protein